MQLPAEISKRPLFGRYLVELYGSRRKTPASHVNFYKNRVLRSISPWSTKMLNKHFQQATTNPRSPSKGRPCNAHSKFHPKIPSPADFPKISQQSSSSVPRAARREGAQRESQPGKPSTVQRKKLASDALRGFCCRQKTRASVDPIFPAAAIGRLAQGQQPLRHPSRPRLPSRPGALRDAPLPEILSRRNNGRVASPPAPSRRWTAVCPVFVPGEHNGQVKRCALRGARATLSPRRGARGR